MVHVNDISVDDIRRLADEARRPYRPVQGSCGDIIDRLENLLVDEAGLPYRDADVTDKYGRRHVRVGPNGEEKHYVLEINGGLLEEFDAGDTIWVDLSFDQFNDTNKRTEDVPIEVSYGEKSALSTLRIMPPDDARRAEQYQTVGEFV